MHCKPVEKKEELTELNYHSDQPIKQQKLVVFNTDKRINKNTKDSTQRRPTPFIRKRFQIIQN